LGAANLELLNKDLQMKLARIKVNEVRFKEQFVEDAEMVLVAFGTAARVAQTAVQQLRRDGLQVGLFQPISLWPFPEQRLLQLTSTAQTFLVVEMNAGQMVHDVREVVGNRVPVQFMGRMGGIIPMPDDVEAEIRDWFTCQRSATEPEWLEAGDD
jgi:2-oxoglutarate ferredoxin oxidoreductase subunit alpha